MADELIKLEKWGEIAKLYGGGGVPMPFVQEIFLLECDIAGTGFVKDIEKKAAALNVDSIVKLVREPANKYDPMAIRIDNADGEKLGYVPRAQNEVISRLMDGGKILYGKVIEKDLSDHGPWVDITVGIYMKDL